jgi:hypothetical protein
MSGPAPIRIRLKIDLMFDAQAIETPVAFAGS